MRGLSAELLDALAQRKLTLAIAEGDTGGLLLAHCTAVPGSSAVLLGGVVAYADGLKLDLLQVPASVLRVHGAVSGAAAKAMAEGVRRITGAGVGLATTGIAGPGGATATKPVGLAYVAAAMPGGTVVREHRWRGDRQANREASAAAAAALVAELLGAHQNT